MTTNIETNTPTDAEIQASSDRGNELFFELKEQIEDEEVDPVGVAYSLWINLIYYLASAGWNAEELTKDLVYHITSQSTEGNA